MVPCAALIFGRFPVCLYLYLHISALHVQCNTRRQGRLQIDNRIPLMHAFCDPATVQSLHNGMFQFAFGNIRRNHTDQFLIQISIIPKHFGQSEHFF